MSFQTGDTVKLKHNNNNYFIIAIGWWNRDGHLLDKTTAIYRPHNMIHSKCLLYERMSNNAKRHGNRRYDKN